MSFVSHEKLSNLSRGMINGKPARKIVLPGTFNSNGDNYIASDLIVYSTSHKTK